MIGERHAYVYSTTVVGFRTMVLSRLARLLDVGLYACPCKSLAAPVTQPLSIYMHMQPREIFGGIDERRRARRVVQASCVHFFLFPAFRSQLLSVATVSPLIGLQTQYTQVAD